MTALGWDQLAAWRLRRHHLDEPASDLVEVASRLCGVHAQLMGSAELTLWARVEGLEREAVSHALWEERTLIKTWAMRGTLHLLPTAELGLWEAGLGTYQHYLKPVWLRAFGISREQLLALIDGVRDVLDGRELTREELADAVAAHTGHAELAGKLRESWGAFLKPAAFQGHLVFAPSDGQKVRFTGPPAVEPVEDPLPEIVRRYLAVHGPATREDVARWWSQITPAAAGRLLKAFAVEVDVEGTPMWMHEDHAREAAGLSAPSGVRLLPAFDQYVIAATKHAGPLIDGGSPEHVYRKQGWLSAVILDGGRMVGVWRHERKGRFVDVELEPFRKPTKALRAGVEAEAERLAAFLGGEPRLTWSRT